MTGMTGGLILHKKKKEKSLNEYFHLFSFLKDKSVWTEIQPVSSHTRHNPSYTLFINRKSSFLSN